MAKRFTATDKWRKPFIKTLQAPYKLLWLYLLDDCNHAGIWDVDIEVASLRISAPVELEKAKDVFKEKITIFDNGNKWFIPDFIEFQYGSLNEKNRVHKSVLDTLNKYDLKDPSKGLNSPKLGCKDKYKEKDIEIRDRSNSKEKIQKEKFYKTEWFDVQCMQNSIDKKLCWWIFCVFWDNRIIATGAEPKDRDVKDYFSKFIRSFGTDPMSKQWNKLTISPKLQEEYEKYQTENQLH